MVCTLARVAIRRKASRSIHEVLRRYRRYRRDPRTGRHRPVGRRHHEPVAGGQDRPQVPRRHRARSAPSSTGPCQRRGDGHRPTTTWWPKAASSRSSPRTSASRCRSRCDGLKACRALAQAGAKVNVTLCFSAAQAIARRQGRRHLHLALRRPARRCRRRRHGSDRRHRADLRQLSGLHDRSAGGLGAPPRACDRSGQDGRPCRRPCRPPCCARCSTIR